MAKTIYLTEKEGQMAFFDNFRIPYADDASVLVDNTDGVYHGNIMEFKLNIANTGKVLLQAIKYLSRMRIKGESVPARILLIDLNATTVYVYNSADYIDDIQRVYVGAASQGNDAFSRDVTPAAKYDYSDMVGSAAVLQLLINAAPAVWYIPIDLDENCIVGWAERYYREVPNATKGDFLGDGTGKINLQGEIRDPKHFVGLINPYTAPTNEKFKYLMDCLNDRLNKKDLGAFYTPPAYCKKAAELVQMAVERVPDGNDYIILDRCAGTGNLEEALRGLYDKNGSELISHCVVSTYEYYEYKVLLERIGSDVRTVIPPTEANVVYENGKVSNADAMSKDYIENPLIRQYVDDPKCTIILFENPPYTDSSSVTFNESNNVRQRAKSARKNSFVANAFLCSKDDINEKKASSRELSVLFIWSGFHFYMRNSNDSYIVFSPVKYYKRIQLPNMHFRDGFLFNRKHFHATESAISCILWNKIDEKESDPLVLHAYDIYNGALLYQGDMVIRQTNATFEPFYDRRRFADDVETSVFFEYAGTVSTTKKLGTRAVAGDTILAYMKTDSFPPVPLCCHLARGVFYNGRGFYVRVDNYAEKLPLFVAKLFPQENWYDKDVYFTTSDGGDAYTHDPQFLKSCLIYTCLSNQNKCLSFNGSDGRYYRNELCFDTTNGDTVASADLAKMQLDDDEKELMKQWALVLQEAKQTDNYDDRLTYGVYQITKELNTTHEEGSGTSKKPVPDYPTLNGYLVTLRGMLKEYYKSHITEKMFKYELLK